MILFLRDSHDPSPSPPSKNKKRRLGNTFFAPQSSLFWFREIQLIVLSNLPQTNVLIFIGNINVRKENLQFSKEAQIFGQSTHWPFSLF